MRMYTPRDYPYMEDELDSFYKSLDNYTDDKSSKNKLVVEDMLHDLFFILKANLACGRISPSLYDEILSYCKGEIPND